MPPPLIYILPGMGADHRMYPPPWPSLPASRFIDWPVYGGETSVADLARSVAATAPIAADAWLVGSSLGGMVACELTKLMPVRGLILIGSATSREELSPMLGALGSLIDLTPVNFIRQLAGKAPSELAQMFARSDPAFIRAMCRAIVAWPGLGASPVPLYRIHGRRDRVIPLPPKVDLVLGGGHLIAMTHAPECVRLVAGILANRA